MRLLNVLIELILGILFSGIILSCLLACWTLQLLLQTQWVPQLFYNHQPNLFIHTFFMLLGGIVTFADLALALFILAAAARLVVTVWQNIGGFTIKGFDPYIRDGNNKKF